MTTMTPLTDPAGLSPADVLAAIVRAEQEDLGGGPDVTSLCTIPADATTTAAITTRQDGVLAGGPVAAAAIEHLAGPATEVSLLYADGAVISAGTTVLVVHGPARGLMAAERTALNFLCLLSGVATVTARWVAAVAGTGCAVRDTRKTIPGLRGLQKYAVAQGGGVNHRMGLWDAILIKDNHVAAAGGIAAALSAVRRGAPGRPVEIEVDSFQQLDEALDLRAELVLLDNFTPAQCREAVRRKEAAGGHTRLEASGGLCLSMARAFAETGVDYVAVGALTHSAPALDLGMDVVAPQGMPS